MLKLPQGVRASLRIFMIDEATGLEVVAEVGPFHALSLKADIDTAEILKAFNMSGLTATCPRIRMMTDAEISDYLKREREEKAAAAEAAAE